MFPRATLLPPWSAPFLHGFSRVIREVLQARQIALTAFLLISLTLCLAKCIHDTSIGLILVGVVGLCDFEASDEHDPGEVFPSLLLLELLRLQGMCILSILSNCSFCAFKVAISFSNSLFDSITLSDSCETKQWKQVYDTSKLSPQIRLPRC